MAMSNKKLILEFFKDYKPKEKNNVLTIPKAPKEFEEVFWKKAPYKLIFSPNQNNVIKGSDLIAKGSYFLSSIKEYMDNKGQTSLIKLNIKIPSTIINKIPLGNCSISKSQKKTDYDSLPEFTFFSEIHALNEKKQLFKKYLIKEGELLDLDLSNFKFLKANSKEIQGLDIQEQYDFARNNFKEHIENEVKPIKIKLEEKLRTGLDRINDYYKSQINEKDEEIETCKKRIKTMESELKHTFYDRDADTLKRNIKEAKVRCEMLKKQGYKERLEEEKKFHLTDEINKHALIIKNKLVNATIFYYPKIIFSLTLDNNPKTIEIAYNSLFNEFDFNSLVCESCKKNNIKEINICNEGKHLVCKSCLKKCKFCKK